MAFAVVCTFATLVAFAPQADDVPQLGLRPISMTEFSRSREHPEQIGASQHLQQPTPLNRITGGAPTIVVSRATQTVGVYDADGRPIDEFPCATGIYYPRPGNYSVQSRKPSSYSPDDGTRFRFFTIFARSHRNVAIGFHSIPVDSAGKLVGPLGKPISHGCVRVEETKAAFLYEWAANGTVVIVTP